MACQAKTKIKMKKNYVSNSTGKEYPIHDFITCGSMGVIYVLECGCGLQYLGRTSRTLHIRVEKHLRNIKKGVVTHNVSKHFKYVYGEDLS